MARARNARYRFNMKAETNSDLDPESDFFSSKLDKRKLILSKISKLENNISEMLEEDEELSREYGNYSYLEETAGWLHGDALGSRNVMNLTY